MKTIHIFILFLVVVIIQLFVPAKMILGREDVLTTGTLYKFKTRPIDPNDPFRGKYITLRYELNKAKSTDSTWKRGDRIFVYLKEDSLGYAKLHSVSKAKIENNKDYFETKVKWRSKTSNEVSFNLPFDRFYMEEFKAKPAEDAYNISSRERNIIEKPTYALVAIKDGKSVLKNVFINEVPIADYIKKEDNQ